MPNKHSSGQSEPQDVGKTSGGGNLGHQQPSEVVRQTPIRNNPSLEGQAETQTIFKKTRRCRVMIRS